MPLTSKGKKVLAAMRETYGDDEKAKRVFYASVNAGKLTGVHKAKDAAPLMMFDNDTLLDAGTVRHRDGYLICEARVARTGVQRYRGYEVGLDDREHVTLYRPPEEVFAYRAMHSLASKPVTYLHPKQMVDASIWTKVAKGFSGNEVIRDGEYVRVPLMLTDAATIEAFEKGKARELSVGYTTDIDWTPGQTPTGEAYDGVQRDIRANHHALVPVARGGDHLRFGDAGPVGSVCPNCGATLTGEPMACPSCGFDLKPTPRSDDPDAYDGMMDFDPDQPRDETGKWTAAEEAEFKSALSKIAELQKKNPPKREKADWNVRGPNDLNPEDYDDNDQNWYRPKTPEEPTAFRPPELHARDAAPPYWLNDKEFSAEERKSLAEKGHALPGGGYPIRNRSDLGNAIQAFGRAKNPAATKALIRRRAKELGATKMLPESWQSDAADGGMKREEGVMPIIKTFDGIPVSFVDEASAAVMEREMTRLQRQLADQESNFGGKKAKPFGKKGNGNGNGNDTDDEDMEDQDADAIEAARKKVTAEDGLKKAVAAKDGEIAVLKKQLADAATLDAKIEALAAERITVIDAAKPFLPKDFKDAGKSLADIRRAAVGTHMGDAEIKDWTDDQIIGAFRTMAKSGASKGGGAQALADGMSRGFKEMGGYVGDGRSLTDAEKEATTAYAEYCKRITDGYKQPFSVVRN